MNPFPRHILRKLLADYGTTLLDEPERVDAFLADLCGEYRRERYLIVQAMRWRVPADLLSQPQGVATVGPRLSRRLQEQYGLSAEAAQWAIESWAMALDVEELPFWNRGISASDDVSTDRDALVAFYHATNGANWVKSENWLSDAPLDTWHGVTTDSSGRVIKLALSRNKLSGGIPVETGNLFCLTQLNLSNYEEWTDESYDLTGPIPAELDDLSSLTQLDLSDYENWTDERNDLTGPIPAELISPISQIRR